MAPAVWPGVPQMDLVGEGPKRRTVWYYDQRQGMNQGKINFRGRRTVVELGFGCTTEWKMN